MVLEVGLGVTLEWRRVRNGRKALKSRPVEFLGASIRVLCSQ